MLQFLMGKFKGPNKISRIEDGLTKIYSASPHHVKTGTTMAMSRIIRTLGPRSALLNFSRRFSDGSVSDAGIRHHNESIRSYRVGVSLPYKKWSDSNEEKDDWYHWFLSSSCDGSKAAGAPIKNHRDPRILWTHPGGFCARLSVQDVFSLWKRDGFRYAVPDRKADLEQQKKCEISGSPKKSGGGQDSSSSYRDPRILETRPNGFCARLSVQDIEALLKRDEFISAELGGKVDWTVGAIPYEPFKAPDEPKLDVDIDNGEYSVYVMLPEEKRSGSKEERDDWFHWFLSSAAPTKSSSSNEGSKDTGN